MSTFESFISLLEILNERPALKSAVQFTSMIVLALGFYRYAVRPALNFHWKVLGTLDSVQHAVPVLLDIAAQFRPNGGNSLKDVLNKIEHRLNASDERMLALLRASANAYFESDCDGYYLWVNRQWCELTGMMPEDAAGMGWISAVHVDDQVKVSDHWRLCVDQRREFNMEYRIRTCCEERLLLTVRSVAQVMWDDAHKRPRGWIGSITELKPKAPPSEP